MSWDPQRSIVRVLGPGGATAGTGFFVMGDGGPMVATCSHVVRAAEPADGIVRVEAGGAVRGARIEEAYARHPDAEDITVLRLEGGIPDGCEPIVLARLVDEGRPHKSFGFAWAKREEGIGAHVREFGPTAEGGSDARFAFSDQVTKGFSGAPVWDAEAGVAVGMVMSVPTDPAGRLGSTFIMRPAEALWEVCPELRGAPDNPYRGLEVFEEEHADLYHGRSKAIDDLLAALDSKHLVAVVGPSGSGKSSLVRAGLAKGLAERPVYGLAERPRIRFRPGEDPLLDLALAVAGAGGVDSLPAESGDLRAALPVPAILVADQFERLFTECPTDDLRQRFADTLLELAGPHVKVVLTLRADFYGRVLQMPALGRAVAEGQVTLLPMTRQELLDVIVEPARARHRALERELAEQLVADVAGHPGDLPLLQLVLTELWARDAETGLLTMASYKALGGQSARGEALFVRGVIARLADEHWNALDEEERALATPLLVSLVKPAHAGHPASRRAWQPEFDTPTLAVAQKLVDARLLTTGYDANTIEVAHESLITTWPVLGELARRHADYMQWYEADFAYWLRRWNQDRDDTDVLLRGAALRKAEGWLEDSPELLPGPAVEFIRRSAAERDRAAAAAREPSVTESLRLAAEAGDVADSEPETAFLVAWEALLRDRNERSEGAFRDALARLEATVTVLAPASRESVVAGFSGTRVFVAAPKRGTVWLHSLEGARLGGFSVDGTGTTSVAALGEQILTYRDGVLRLHDENGDVLSALDLPVARTVYDQGITVAERGVCLVHVADRAWLVDVGDGGLESARGLALPEGRTFHARIDADGELALTEGDDVRVWNRDGSLRAVLATSDRPASAASLGDGTLVTGTLGGEGEHWDADGERLGTFREAGEGLDLFIRAVDRRRTRFAATVNHRYTVEVYDLRSEELVTLAGHGGHVWSAAFSPTGRRLASGSRDRTVRVWDLEDGREVHVLHGHEATVGHVEFHPHDDALLLSADHEGSVRLWRLEGAVLEPYVGHVKPVRRLARTPAGTLAAADDGARLWSPDGRGAPLDGELLSWTGGPGPGQAFALTFDGVSLSLWDLGPDPPNRLCQGPGPKVGVEGSDIAPDGRHYVLVDGAGAALWSAAGEPVRELVGADHEGVDESHEKVVGLGFRADGTSVAVASRNGTVWLWDVDGTPRATFLADTASPDRILTMASDPLGELIAVGIRKEAGLWSWDGDRVAALRTEGYKVHRVAFSPDGSRFLTISDSGQAFAELWTREGERVALLDTLDVHAFAVATFDERSRYFCIASGGAVAIVDREGAHLGSLGAARGVHFGNVAISPGGDLVAVPFSDGIARIWSYAEKRRTMSLRIGEAGAVAFSGDGRELLVASAEGPIHRHALDVADLYEPAGRRVGRVLTPEELARFGIDEPRLTLAALRA